jgi:hypothetical protein
VWAGGSSHAELTTKFVLETLREEPHKQ